MNNPRNTNRLYKFTRALLDKVTTRVYKKEAKNCISCEDEHSHRRTVSGVQAHTHTQILTARNLYFNNWFDTSICVNEKKITFTAPLYSTSSDPAVTKNIPNLLLLNPFLSP